jgi:hypothetical protein
MLGQRSSSALIFISYASEDVRRARQLAQRLSDRGLRAFLAARDMNGAVAAGRQETWVGTLDQLLEEATALVLIVSPDALASPVVEYEWRTVHGHIVNGRAKRLIPICARGMKPAGLPPPLNAYQALDGRGADRWALALREVLVRVGRGHTGLPPLAGIARRVDQHQRRLGVIAVGLGAMALLASPVQRWSAARQARAILAEAEAAGTASGAAGWSAAGERLRRLGPPAVEPLFTHLREQPDLRVLHDGTRALMDAAVRLAAGGPGARRAVCQGLTAMFRAEGSPGYEVVTYELALEALDELACAEGRIVAGQFRRNICGPRALKLVRGSRDYLPELVARLDRFLGQADRRCEEERWL